MRTSDDRPFCSHRFSLAPECVEPGPEPGAWRVNPRPNQLPMLLFVNLKYANAMALSACLFKVDFASCKHFFGYTAGPQRFLYAIAVHTL